MIVHVEGIVIDHGSTVGVGYGHDEAGRFIEFGGDRRSMQALQGALAEGEYPTAEIEPWQVLTATHDR